VYIVARKQQTLQGEVLKANGQAVVESSGQSDTETTYGKV